jgi:antirestriction protein ArdC
MIYGYARVSTDGHSVAAQVAQLEVYRGINHLVLGLAQAVRFRDDPRWCSYRQAQAKGWQVRKGERGTMIVFFKRVEKRDQAEGGEEPSFYQLLKCSTVFHASQIEGIPDYVRPELGAVAWQRPDALDIIMANSKAVIRTGGAQAFYSPATDHIQLPPTEAFTSAEGFAHVAVHEMGHWAFARPHLGLTKNRAFGSASYAAEELRVDIAASMMCSTIGIGTDIENTAAYVQNVPLRCDFQFPIICMPIITPSLISVSLERARHMTVLPGGGSVARAR